MFLKGREAQCNNMKGSTSASTLYLNKETPCASTLFCPTLTIMKDHGTVAKASEINILIFTQFYPCVPCQSEMRVWQNQARTTAGTAGVFISVWTLTASFSPLSSNPKKRAQPAITDESTIQGVPITFDTSSNSPQLLS
jgi:hypothetical protein